MENQVQVYEAMPLSAKAQWQRRQRNAFKSIRGYSQSANYGTGQQRHIILMRDDYKCVECGMDDIEHKAKWNRPITIHHKDRNRSNNTPDNLEVLCLSCHGRKDQLPELRNQKVPQYKEQILAMRGNGKTYQQIADKLKISIASVWKWSKRWEA